MDRGPEQRRSEQHQSDRRESEQRRSDRREPDRRESGRRESDRRELERRKSSGKRHGRFAAVIIAGAAVLSIICSFMGKLSTLISTIPGPVIGGISFLLYGMIGTSGLRSGIAIKIGNIQLTGMVLACVVGMALSLIFFALDRLKLTNDR